MTLSDISYLALLASSNALLNSVECIVVKVYTQHFDDMNANGEQWVLENIPNGHFFIHLIVVVYHIFKLIQFFSRNTCRSKTLKSLVTKLLK
jgi:hypothetical protein